MPTRVPFHQPKFRVPTREDERQSSSRRGYDARWRRFREWFLRTHNYLCAYRNHPFAKAECLVAADTVDHVTPLPKGARLDPANCRPVCRNCHAKITRNWTDHHVNEMPAGPGGPTINRGTTP